MKGTLYFLVILSLIGLMLANPAEVDQDSEEEGQQPSKAAEKAAEATKRKAVKEADDGDEKPKHKGGADDGSPLKMMAPFLQPVEGLMGGGMGIIQGAMNGFKKGMDSAMGRGKNKEEDE